MVIRAVKNDVVVTDVAPGVADVASMEEGAALTTGVQVR